MFLSYLDSSGRADYDDPENYVIASITVNEHNWHFMRNEIVKIKKRHFPDFKIEEVEFHAKDMLNQTGIYKELSWEEIYGIFDDFFNFITNDETHLTIISSLIKKKELYRKIDLEIWGHRFLFERLNVYLNSQNEAFAKIGKPHEYGIMIIDSEGHRKDQKLRNKLSELLSDETCYSELSYLIEDPLFTDSKWRNLSQVADCIAYCIRKHYRENTPSIHTTKWETYFSMIEKKFHSKDGKYLKYGLKIFP